MTPEDSLRELQAFMKKVKQANILMASSDPAVDEEITVQRLTITDPISKRFLEFASVVLDQVGQEPILRKYEPGFNPSDEEICYIPITESDLVKNVIDAVSKIDQAQMFREDEDVINNLRFYSVIAEDNSRQAIFFRTYSAKKELTRSHRLALTFQDGTYDGIKQKIFLFDEDADCFAWGDYLFIISVPQFQKIFGYFEALVKRAEETINAVSARVPISNVNEFKAACKGNVLMLAKVAQIARSSYISRITMVDIERTIEEFKLDVETENGKLVFDPNPKRRWTILKLLDDDYLGSVMTKLKYEANSKVQL